MAVLVEFINGIIEILRDAGNACLSLMLIIYGLKLVFGNPDSRDDAKRMLLMILAAFILINFSDRLISELLAITA